MDYTLIEKIIKRTGKVIRDYAVLDVGLVMSHDTTTPLAIDAFNNFKEKSFFDKNKIKIFFDHVYPSSHSSASEQHRKMINFSEKNELKTYRGQGICHTLMVDKYVKPEMVVVGGDSHTPVYGILSALAFGMGSTDIAACWKTGKTWIKIPESLLIEIKGELQKGVYSKDIALRYVSEITSRGGLNKALEFTGSTLRKMDKFDRMAIGIMATETSAQTQIFWDQESGLTGDKKANYKEKYLIDITSLEPQVACPHEVDNIHPVTEVEGIEIDQVFVGSCTNGNYKDMEIVAKIIEDNKVDSNTRFIIIPATKKIFLQAMENGLISIFLKAGAIVCYPSCGPCLGRQQGVLASGERCLSTSNRNYKGRMGSPKAEIYLASPAVAAATAIKGEIADPRRYI